MTRPRDYLLPHEAARTLQITVPTLASWAEQGLIQSNRTPTGQRRYARADVEAFVRGQDQAALVLTTPDGAVHVQVRPGTDARTLASLALLVSEAQQLLGQAAS